jgi:protein gp37
MGDKSAIEWTDATWNPTVGCSFVSPGCAHCYAMRMASRLEKMGQQRYTGLTSPTKARAVWTGEVRVAPIETLLQPLRWKRPRRIFVDSMSDLFHEKVQDGAIAYIFAVMALATQHEFQVLTKRGDRMQRFMRNEYMSRLVWRLIREIYEADVDTPYSIFGTGAYHGAKASGRFLSLEPLLGPITIDPAALRDMDWAIVGGESGLDARPMDSNWARSLRDQCIDAGVPFFFKQWGEHDEHGVRVGKRHAGAELDRRECREMPA